MSKSNERKSKALGQPHGTAAHRLRKNILFSLVCKLEENICFQCGGEILTVEDLSIEHKEPWLQADDPVKSFFDLGNIAFSHLSCNCAAATMTHKKYANVKERWHEAYKRKYARMNTEERQADRHRRYEKFGC